MPVNPLAPLGDRGTDHYSFVPNAGMDGPNLMHAHRREGLPSGVRRRREGEESTDDL